MGKVLDEGQCTGVKPEVVSASANLEVVSRESFVKRLEGMSSSACVNCHRERARTQRTKHQVRKGKNSRRKQAHPKASSPIVIHLKDTLKKPNYLSSTESDVRSSEEEQHCQMPSRFNYRNGCFTTHKQNTQGTVSDFTKLTSFYQDYASIPEFIPSSYYVPIHQAYPPLHHFHFMTQMSSGFMLPRFHKSCLEHSSTMLKNAKDKSKKNLTALISVIEKSHKKETSDLELNLKDSNTLNNTVVMSLKNENTTKRHNISVCKNVEVICNDFSCEKVTESTDESDTSSDSVASSSDTHSDDVELTVLADDVKEMSKNELEQLAEYTAGMPLIKYDLPTQCQECINTWYSDQQQQEQRYSFKGNGSVEEGQCGSDKIDTNASLISTSSHRGSLSSESDLSSDIDELPSSNLPSESSSPIQSSSPSSSPPPMFKNKETYKNLSHEKQYQRKPQYVVPRIYTVGYYDKKKSPYHCQYNNSFTNLKKDRQLWDIALSHCHKSSQNPVVDSVYMDLTGLDVTYKVIYHSEATWPQPIHSLYDFAFPSTTPQLGGDSNKLYNFPLYYPIKTQEYIPPTDWKKRK